MYDYGKIVYLNVEKTGSSFVRHFLDNTLNVAPGQFSPKKQANGLFNADILYLATVRNPLTQYASLFRFGVSGNGALFHNLKQNRFVKLYEAANIPNFEKWLAFVLKPQLARYTSDSYAKSQPQLHGYMSYRFLSITLQNPEKHLRKRESKGARQQAYEAHRFPAFIAKNETLNHDLLAFSQTPKAEKCFKSTDQIQNWLNSAQKVNANKADTYLDPNAISSELITRLKEREWFIYQNFYPELL